MIWSVNGKIYQEADQTGYVVTRETVAGIRHCNLTVQTTSAENNGTTVQCILTTFSPISSVSSDNATLIVLPGKLQLITEQERVNIIFFVQVLATSEI